MNRQQVIDTTGCPKCKAKPGTPCTDDGYQHRKRSHVERLYRAQDIEAGKPDRVTGEANTDHQADRRCPYCHKVLKSPEGAINHIMDAHGYTRDEAKEGRREYLRKHRGDSTAKPSQDDEFDLIDDSDAF